MRFAIACAVSLAAVTAGSLAFSAWLYRSVRAYEREHGVSVVFGSGRPATPSPSHSATQPPSHSATRLPSHSATQPLRHSATPSPTNSLHVAHVDYDGEKRLEVTLSARPDMTGIRQYVSVAPLNEGFIGVSYAADYNYEKKVYEPKLVVTGDFAFRTNVTLRIRKGLALYGKGANPEAEGSLESDFTYSFKRKDLDPYVVFADDGRYLPPGGARTIGIESVNCRCVQAEVRRVDAKNVVQLLAREENRYRRYYGGGGDSEDTVELSGEKTVRCADCRNEPNKKDIWRLPVSVEAPGPANGVYLVAVGNGEKPFCTEEWREVKGEWICEGDWYNPPRYRLVCLSDLGLSVRTNANGLGVWVTSLTTGRPVADATVEVYSASNVKIREGSTSGDGWCEPKRVAAGEPFAVVVRTKDGSDMTFMAISRRMTVDETYKSGARKPYLAKNECAGFAWTERGIYRHDEKIFFHLILRDGTMKAPKPFPVTLELVNPKGDVCASATALPDARGALAYEKFTVPADQPSGAWRIRARLPGKDGKTLAVRDVKIEEFAPPQIRVKVVADENVAPEKFAFSVSAEHLFGGPAATLACAGAVVFEDVPFAPEAWKGYRFGNEDLGLRPSFRELDEKTLDADGATRFDAPIWKDSGRPKAMVRATGQGVVFEDGGRAATARASTILHYYPYYIGSTLSDWITKDHAGRVTMNLACVGPDGKRVAEPKSLTVKIDRIDSIYTCSENGRGWMTWNCERIRSLAADEATIVTKTDDDTSVPLPLVESGDYAVTVTDPVTGVSYGHTFYLSDGDDCAVRAPLADPSEVTLRADKSFYRVGETPRLVVKSPFAGYAMVSVQRDVERYTEILELTNATSVVALRPVTKEDAPNLDVYVSVVQSVEANAKHLAVRAHGQTTVRVKPLENEVPVKVDAAVEIVNGSAETGARVCVSLAAPGATHAVVTVVDEGINILTGEETPDPIARFAEVRCAEHPLFDLYGRILPVDEASVKARGVKTGGDFGADMLGRVSPVGTRRFKPLARWDANVELKEGRAETTIELPPFVGEVRVTAVAWSDVATGAKSVQKKVTPKLVAQPDAPRFVAPGDTFEALLPLHNRSGAAGEVTAKINDKVFESFRMEKDAATNLIVRLTAPSVPGDFNLVYTAEGFGERHVETIAVPVRPAVAWVETAGVKTVGAAKGDATEVGAAKGDATFLSREKEAAHLTPCERYTSRVFDSPLGEYEAALRWLAEYKHGCLEQTCSRVFPLIAAGGLLNTVVTNSPGAVARGVARVESMVNEDGFVMWPDCSYPAEPEVALYAAHFLFAAEKAGTKLDPRAKELAMKFVKKHSYKSGSDVYASLVRAIGGEPDKDRIFRLYDSRKTLSALARARLSLAFAEIDDLPRAKNLLKDSYEPQSVKEAAFQLMARVAVDPKDARVLPLVAWLNARRDRSKNSWGTTERNAHALMAIGAYYQANPPKKGEKFLAWRKLTLPKLEEVKDESEGIAIERRFIHADGTPADLENLRCGELLFAEISLSSSVTQTVHDLVIEDLFAGAFDPVHRELPPPGHSVTQPPITDWVLRTDARDDRMLIFSKPFTLEPGRAAQMTYPVRVVSAGEFVLPGPSVEAMYNPQLHARRAPQRVTVRRPPVRGAPSRPAR